MYDEHIRRSARYFDVRPIQFQHPASGSVLEAITGATPVSVILTGTAGDGKTHLCRQVWEALKGSEREWLSPEPYLRIAFPGPGQDLRVLHIVRDLSAWVPQRKAPWDPDAHELLRRFSATLFPSGGSQPSQDIFLIAGNDGQLMETWRRLGNSEPVKRSHDLFEALLVEGRKEQEGVSLRFFNLSRHESADLLGSAVDAFVAHEAWQSCYALDAASGEFFGPECPIRRNLELIQQPLVRERLGNLLALCDYNGLHMPIRQILLLLVNAILGHADVKDGLMTATDVPDIIRHGIVAKASLYDNVFGGNLTETRRARTPIFEALDRIGVGHETSNRVDNILIFGDTDDALRAYHDRYMTADRFYGANTTYQAAQKEYVEGTDETGERSARFLRMLVAQRRRLFFKIADDEADEMLLWDLTVFQHAGEYLNQIVNRLKTRQRVERQILAHIVKGLNRIFIGMLVSDDQRLLLANSFAPSQGRVSRLFVDEISAEPRLGERIDIVMHKDDPVPVLQVTLGPGNSCSMPLHITRYEFLTRVAKGALPGSFSRECYEDLLAFKSQLLKAAVKRSADSTEKTTGEELAFSLLQLESTGRTVPRRLELRKS
ncbi:hypothetical protein [Nonomuraea maritima]|uniref:hypothetical protein n=1 Tax=Nonomuraea maritima TaxID=683260 RepID=UPI00371B95A0